MFYFVLQVTIYDMYDVVLLLYVERFDGNNVNDQVDGNCKFYCCCFFIFYFYFCFLFLIYIYIYIYLNPLLKSGVFLNALQLLYDNFLNKIK